jgi:hypothetical protein
LFLNSDDLESCLNQTLYGYEYDYGGEKEIWESERTLCDGKGVELTTSIYIQNIIINYVLKISKLLDKL